jgi:hypothetical protein
MAYESLLISKARASVRRLLLLSLVSFCGFFAYGASTASKPVAVGIFTGIVFGLPFAVAAWIMLGFVRFAFRSPDRQ